MTYKTGEGANAALKVGRWEVDEREVSWVGISKHLCGSEWEWEIVLLLDTTNTMRLPPPGRR